MGATRRVGVEKLNYLRQWMSWYGRKRCPDERAMIDAFSMIVCCVMEEWVPWLETWKGNV
jgi:hypothetical protein